VLSIAKACELARGFGIRRLPEADLRVAPYSHNTADRFRPLPTTVGRSFRRRDRVAKGAIVTPGRADGDDQRERPLVLSDYATGDIVECIDDTPSRPESQIMPDLGALYTVTSIRPAGDGQSVRLKELTPSCHLGGVCACGACGWDAGRFRKVLRPRAEFIAELLEPIYEPA
jgi:hypothetical protein